ncbi:MAG: hypothetical protein IPP15_01005 [Saprospiraceae bacterium]|uniref:Lipoprotein n=1 Tax=Candidatus Opimibacter skivensis TaxID=2982028 RepID=A0A9D7XR76_9BACT|nr:hypothetical protein [Candidatus Opimibacter skivensis]
MKNILFVFVAFCAIVFLSSCGINAGVISNLNSNATEVQLSSNNFKVVDKINGSAKVSYVLMFGGMNKKQLFENAYSAMMDKANLNGSARAVINMVTEEHIGGVPPFYYTRTVTVSANVIEFTK